MENLTQIPAIHFMAQCFPLCRLSLSVVAAVTVVVAALSVNINRAMIAPHQCGISDEWFVGGIVTPTLNTTMVTKLLHL